MADRVFPGMTLMRSLALTPEVDNDVWLTWPPEHSLPLEASAYMVDQREGGWAVLTKAGGEVVHTSPNPLELVRIRSAKGPGFEFTLDDQLQKINVAATIAAAAPAPTPPGTALEGPDTPLPQDPFGPGHSVPTLIYPAPVSTDDLEPATTSDRTMRAEAVVAIDAAWGRVAQLLLTVISDRGIYVPPSQTGNVNAWLNALRRDDVLPARLTQLVSDLWNLRNKVVYEQQRIDMPRAQEYAESASKILKAITKAIQSDRSSSSSGSPSSDRPPETTTKG